MNESYELYEFATKVNTMVIFYLIIGLCIMFISDVLGYILKEGKAFLEFFKQISYRIQKFIVEFENNRYRGSANPGYDHRKPNKKTQKSAFTPTLFIVFG